MHTKQAKLDYAYTLASHRCDDTCPPEIVMELAKKIYKEEITDWDVTGDDHESVEEESCLFNQS